MNTDIKLENLQRPLLQVVPFQKLWKVFIPAIVIFVLTFISVFFSAGTENGMSEADHFSLKFLKGNSLFSQTSDNAQVTKITNLNNLINNQVLSTDANTTVMLLIDDYGSLTLSENSKIKIAQNNLAQNQLSLQLLQGKVWVNNNYLPVSINLQTKSSLYSIQQAIVSIEVGELNEVALGIDHAVAGQFNNTNNHFTLTPGKEINIVNNEISEIKYLNLSDESLGTSIRSNLQQDTVLRQSYDSYTKNVLNLLPYSVIDQIAYKINNYKRVLSVLPFSNKSYVLNSSKYFLAKSVHDNNPDELISFLQANSNLVSDLVLAIAHNYGAYFYSVLPGDDLYQMKSQLIDLETSLNDAGPQSIYKKFDKEKDRLFAIMDLLKKGQSTLAISTFVEYQSDMNDILSTNNVTPDDRYLSILIFHKQILDDLYYNYFYFYKHNLLDIYLNLSNRVWDIVKKTEVKESYAEDLIANDLRIVNNLIAVIKNKIVKGDEMTNFADRILLHSKFLLDDPDFEYDQNNQVHVYFSQQILQLQSLVDFIKSLDFKTSNASFDDAYQEFLSKQQDLSQLNQYLNIDAKPNTGSKRINPATIIQNVYNEFKDAGLEIQGLESLNDKEFRLFSFEKSIYQGIPFYGKYDYETKVVYDLFVDDQVVATGISLKDLPDSLVKIRLGNSDTENDDMQSISDQNTIETGHASANGKVSTSAPKVKK